MTKLFTFNNNKRIPHWFARFGADNVKTFKPLKNTEIKARLNKEVSKYVDYAYQVNPYCPEATEYGDASFCKFAISFKNEWAYEVGGEVFGVAFFDSISEINQTLLENVVPSVCRKYKAGSISAKSFKAFKKASERGSIGCFFKEVKKSLRKMFSAYY